MEWLLGSVARNTTGVAVKLQHDPQSYLQTNTSVQAALVRQIFGMEPLDTDRDAITEAVSDFAAHIREHREPRHEGFQKGYAELILKQDEGLRKATVELIEEEWRTKQKIGHYELLSALVMGYEDEEVVQKTLSEIHGHLTTWGNEGWCPWTPALWMRILWLGEHITDASADITAQLEFIGSHLSEDGQFQYREPFCLMYSIGQMDHPLGDRMRERFLHVIVERQEPDGGWGENSYMVFALLRKWSFLEDLAP